MKTIYFFGANHPQYGFLSNYYPCDIKWRGLHFRSSEALFMHFKAYHFGDMRIVDEIQNNPQSADPKYCKSLGRRVRNYDDSVWNAIRDYYMARAIRYKFSCNQFLQRKLAELGTDVEFVEASPYDKIWGIGLDIKYAKITPRDQWLGENRLGTLLTKFAKEHHDELARGMYLFTEN